jgi:uncharacterized protein (TIGR04141 family)
MPTRMMTVFLMKENRQPEDCLSDDHKLVETRGSNDLPKGTRIFLRKGKPKAPWWKDYFGLTEALDQTTNGALIFVPVAGRTFAIAFGYAHTRLRDDSFEHDFGARVVLNAVDPIKLKNADTLDPGSARRRRTQLPFDADLTYFELISDDAVLKNLTGKTRAEYEHLTKTVTGSNSLHISTAVTAKELETLLREILTVSLKRDYLTIFPELQRVQPLTDPSIVEELDQHLIAAIFDPTAHLALTVPDVIDYSDEYAVRFSGAGPSKIFPDVYIKQYREYLERKESISFIFYTCCIIEASSAAIGR